MSYERTNQVKDGDQAVSGNFSHDPIEPIATQGVLMHGVDADGVIQAVFVDEDDSRLQTQDQDLHFTLTQILNELETLNRNFALTFELEDH